jgi:cyclase
MIRVKPLTIIETDYFTLKEVAEGVYGAIVKDGKGAWGNAGIIDLGDATLVFDTFLTADAARELRRVAIEVTSSYIKYVINSHCHFDHVLGNEVFADATIISTVETYHLMKSMYDFSNIEEERRGLLDHIEDLKKQMALETEPSIIKALKDVEIEEKTRLLEALPNITLVLPTVTFKDSLVIHGSKRSVELYTFGGGHSQNDTFLVIPDEKVAFTADLVFNETHPSIHVQSPREWIAILEKMRAFDVETLVPGHGDVARREQFDSMLRYLKAMVERAELAYHRGESIDAISEIPADYKKWNLAHVYKWNLASIFKQLQQKIVRKGSA